MIIKKTLYPKTERVKISNKNKCQITEKLDGSNLCIFKLNDVLYWKHQYEEQVKENEKQQKEIEYLKDFKFRVVKRISELESED